MDYEKYINRAIMNIGKLQSGTLFTLKELFRGIDWNNIPGGERRELGRRFKYEVKSGKIPNVTYVSKAENNSSQYIKQ